MQNRGLKGGRYRPLTDGEIRKVRDAAVTILEQTGFEVDDTEVRNFFKNAGACVRNNRVTLTRALIEDAVDRAPKKIFLAGRAKKHDIFLEKKRVYVGTGGTALFIIDLKTGRLRRTHLRDVSHLARLVDCLDNIHFFVIPVYPTELDSKQVDVSRFYHAISNTTKHVQSGVYSLDGIKNVIEMCEVIAGGENALRRRPIVSFITSWMISPLRFNTHVTSFLIEICRRRMPAVLSCAPIAGITAPVTIAGMLSQTIAEQLAGITLTQIVSPGTPVIPGPIPAIADMRTGTYLSGSAEMGLANAAVAQILHSYGFPLYNSSGMTDSKLPDIQAGAEKAMSLVVDALSGANYIHHAAGLLENMTTVAPEQYVIDNEIIGMSLRIVKGIEVNEETLAVDAVNRTGPGGIYLMDDLTLRHMRDEFFYPSFVISREMRDLWRMAGKEDARRRARQVALDFITHHTPVPIDPEIDSLIRKRYRPVTDLHQNRTKTERMES